MGKPVNQNSKLEEGQGPEGVYYYHKSVPYIFPDSTASKEKQCMTSLKWIRWIIINKGTHNMHIWCHNIFPQGSQFLCVSPKVCNYKNRCIHHVSQESESIRVMHGNHVVTACRSLPIFRLP